MKKILSIIALLLMAVTGNAAEKSETISLIGEEHSENETATGTHFKVTCGYLGIDDGGLTINKFGAMTVSALDGTVMTKVTWSYQALSQNAGTLSATPGTYNGSNTVTGINSTTQTVTSSHAAGVKLSSITIYYEVEDVAVTGITLDKTSAEMTVGGNALTLTATVAPDDATNKTVTWTTSDASVATVANGVVTAKGAGTATITATATNGTADTSDDKTATCEVTVADAATKYNLTLVDGSEDHGSVAFTVGGKAATQAKMGDVVTVAVTPATGYAAKDVTVRASTTFDAGTARRRDIPMQDDIAVTKQQNGTWQFAMPEASVWVTVTYAKNLQDAWIEAIADQTYTGQAIEPTVTMQDGSAVLTSGTDYTVAYTNNTAVGEATVTVTGQGNYSGTATTTFRILANKTALDDAITEAETYCNSITEVDPDAAVVLQAAIDAAKGVQGNANATQSEVESAAQTLNEAVDAAKADVALKRVKLVIPAKSYVSWIDADKRQIETPVSGVSLHTVAAVSDKQVQLTDELSVMAAEKPYLIYNGGDAEANVSIVVSSGDADNVDYDSEHFKGTLEPKTFSAEEMQAADHYVLQNGHNFVWVEQPGTLAAGKCWIELDLSPSPVRRLAIVVGGTQTGISTVAQEAQAQEAVYDLQGRRVMQPTKGLFIVGGKKVVIK